MLKSTAILEIMLGYLSMGIKKLNQNSKRKLEFRREQRPSSNGQR